MKFQIRQCNKAPRMAKKQRKRLGRNDVCVKTLAKKTVPITMRDGTQYKGMNPVYRNMAAPHELPNFVKVMSGTPFVRLNY